MSHMVIYRTADGQPGYHQAEELDEAVRFVERLRNGDGVDGARIFRMEEVNFDFRPYFKVEIGPGGTAVEANGFGAGYDAPAYEGPAPAYEAPAAYEAPTPAFDAGGWAEPEVAAADRAEPMGLGLDADPVPSFVAPSADTAVVDALPEPAAFEGPGPVGDDEPTEGLGTRRGLFGR